MDRAAVDFSDVANDGEAEARARLTGGVEPRAAGEQLIAQLFGNPGPVILDLNVDLPTLGLDRHEHAAAAIFCGILDQVAEHFVDILALDPDLHPAVARNVHGDVLVEAVDCALD